MIEIPKTISDLLTPDAKIQLAAAERIINALNNLQVVVVLPTGQQLSGTIQMSGENAIVYIRANAGGTP